MVVVGDGWSGVDLARLCMVLGDPSPPLGAFWSLYLGGGVAGVDSHAAPSAGESHGRAIVAGAVEGVAEPVACCGCGGGGGGGSGAVSGVGGVPGSGSFGAPEPPPPSPDPLEFPLEFPLGSRALAAPVPAPPERLRVCLGDLGLLPELKPSPMPSSSPSPMPERDGPGEGWPIR